MAKVNGHRIELGTRLQLVRKTARVGARQIEKELGWHEGKVSRVERGRRVPTLAEINAWADLCQVSTEERGSLQELWSLAYKKEHSDSRVPDFAQGYTALQAKATHIDYLNPELVNGLVQTENYARALLAISRTGDREAQLAARMERQAILHRPDAPRLRLLLGEAVLHNEVGGPKVLREQLVHLLKIGELDSVDLKIWPFKFGSHRAIGMGFALIRVADPEIARVYIEGLTGATYLHDVDEVNTYAEDFEQIWSAAPSIEESATILRRHIGRSED